METWAGIRGPPVASEGHWSSAMGTTRSRWSAWRTQPRWWMRS